MQKRHFYFIVPVWGQAYVDKFIHVCLPMLLAINGNLKDLPLNENDSFIIVTTQTDMVNIKGAEAYHSLAALIRVKFILISSGIDLNSSYVAMSHCYKIAMTQHEVVPYATFFVFLTPDSFWSENTFLQLLHGRESGHKVIAAIGFRTNEQTIIPHILNLKKNNKINLTFSQMLKLTIDHLHPLTMNMNLLSQQNKFNNNWPSHLHWIDRDKNQIVSHGFHLHPIMVQAPLNITSMITTIDGDFIKNLNYSLNSFHVLQKNFAIELTDANKTTSDKLNKPSIMKIINFSYLHAHEVHLHFFKQKIILAAEPIDLHFDNLVNEFVRKILSGRKNFFIILFLNLKNFIFRILKKTSHLFKKLADALFKFNPNIPKKTPGK